MDIKFIDKISAEDYNNLRKSVEWKTLSDRQTENVLNNSKFFIMADAENKPAAMARVLTDDGNIYFIADVVVHPDYQGNGIGRVLLTKVMEFIDSNIEKGEIVQIHLMSVKGKELFYEKFGFKKRPVDEFGCGMTQWYTK